MNKETKKCATCEKVKPVSEFYFHNHSGKYTKHCKVCKNERQKQYNKRRTNVSGVPHENDIIKALKLQGIYACSGKRSRTRWVDVVAFGCVAIEAKLAQVRDHDYGNTSYSFTFTKKQAEQGIRGDVIIFMIDTDNRTDYFIMRPGS